MKKIWFKRKRYGWGWTPSSWEGWLVTLIYVGTLVYVFRFVDKTSHSGSDTLFVTAIYFLLLTGILMCICYLTGEKPRWQWGNPKKED